VLIYVFDVLLVKNIWTNENHQNQQPLIFKWWLRQSALVTRINFIQMTTAVPRRLNILCIVFKIRVLVCYSQMDNTLYLHHFTMRGPGWLNELGRWI